MEEKTEKIQLINQNSQKYFSYRECFLIHEKRKFDDFLTNISSFQ